MKTRDHNSYQQYGTSGTMTLRQSEFWTASKLFAPGRRHLM